jgi:hypothetical protein
LFFLFILPQAVVAQRSSIDLPSYGVAESRFQPTIESRKRNWIFKMDTNHIIPHKEIEDGDVREIIDYESYFGAEWKIDAKNSLGLRQHFAFHRHQGENDFNLGWVALNYTRSDLGALGGGEFSSVVRHHFPTGVDDYSFMGRHETRLYLIWSKNLPRNWALDLIVNPRFSTYTRSNRAKDREGLSVYYEGELVYEGWKLLSPGGAFAYAHSHNPSPNPITNEDMAWLDLYIEFQLGSHIALGLVLEQEFDFRGDHKAFPWEARTLGVDNRYYWLKTSIRL